MPRSIACLLAVVSTVGCAADDVSLSWGFAFRDADDQARARYVRGRILRGDCAGEERFSTLIAVDAPSMAVPPTLSPGRYGLEGRARDGSCRWFARGCREIELPTDEPQPIIVLLSGREDARECDELDCLEGMCERERTDAGPPPVDGGADTGPAGDGGGDAGPDAGPGSCPMGSTWDAMGMRCRDTEADPRHCGGVGVECADDEWCVDSACVCRDGLTRIAGGACVDMQTDPRNCGSEGIDCSTMGSMVTCRGGTCEDSCNPGQTNCANACVDATSHPLACGMTCAVCTRGRICFESACRDTRPATGCSSCAGCTACTGDFGECVQRGDGILCVKE